MKYIFLIAALTALPALSHDLGHHRALPGSIETAKFELNHVTRSKAGEESSSATFSNLLQTILRSQSGKVYMPATPAQYLDNQRLRVFVAEDVADEVTTQVVNDLNTAFDLWMGAPYYGKNQAIAIYLMIYGSDESAARKIEGEYCDHLSAVGFPSAEWCDPEQNSMWREYVEYGGAALNSAGPVEGSTKLGLGVKNWDWDARAIKSMIYHEIFHIYQNSNIFINDPLAQADPHELFAKKIGKRLESAARNTPWAVEGQADFFTALYTYDRAYFKSSMESSLKDTGAGSSLPLKEWYFEQGEALWNIAFEDPSDRVELAYRIGAWFAAYLVSIHGEASIYRLWESADTLGFAEAFEGIFGTDYKTYIQEFDVWLRQPNEDLYRILDGIYDSKIK